jgi:hypothetical protein
MDSILNSFNPVYFLFKNKNPFRFEFRNLFLKSGILNILGH